MSIEYVDADGQPARIELDEAQAAALIAAANYTGVDLATLAAEMAQAVEGS